LEIPLDAVLHHALGSFTEGINEYQVTVNQTLSTTWWNLRKYISDAQKIEGISIKHDVSVPVSRVPEFIKLADAALMRAFPGIRIVAFGHIGDGNIHYNASMPTAQENTQLLARVADVNRIVYEIIAQLDGSISAEHGLGQLKRKDIHRYKNALELELMSSIKKTLDPLGLMNPGKVI
ncbi:MAG: FAD-linked oxidase C-terminal domain-containing protein, partial [Sulfuriferula sp.]